MLERVPSNAMLAGGVDDMDLLPVLNEAAVLDNVDLRFRVDKIYTNTGPMLLALNPFKWLPLYGDAVCLCWGGGHQPKNPPRRTLGGVCLFEHTPPRMSGRGLTRSL